MGEPDSIPTIAPARPDDFKGFAEYYFARLCRGYVLSLDDTLIRAWLPGHKNASDDGGTWDMSSRMFAALAAWLSDPRRPAVFRIRGVTVDVAELCAAVLERAFDPDSPGFWGRDEFPPRDQRTVESSMLAYGAWLLRDSLLPRISSRALGLLERWLEYFASAPLWSNNWNLFWIVNHAARKALGWSYDQSTIDEAWEIIEGYHRGDGWMTDGPEGHFDDYNWWVFGTHELFWIQMDGESHAARADRIKERLGTRLRLFPHFFGSDGSVSEYGRSISYKFGRLGAAVLGYKLGVWPHSSGMLRRLVRRHLAFYDNVGAIDRVTDTLRQELSEFGHPDVRDSYINTGHPYWAMHAFSALWQIDADDPLWTVPEEALPVEAASYQHVVKPAGWIVTGVQDGGQVLRYQLGTKHGRGEYVAKYGKFLYGSHFPANFGFVEGDVGPDSALCLTDGDHWAHPGVYEEFDATGDYLRARYTLEPAEDGEGVPVETILFPRGEVCLRLHRIGPIRTGSHGARPISLVEGAAALGYAPGRFPTKRVTDEPMASAAWVRPRSGGVRASIILALRGYDRAVGASGFRGTESTNGVHHRAVTPTLAVDSLPAGGVHECACLTVATCRGDRYPDSLPTVGYDWQDDGTVLVTWNGRESAVPPLARPTT